MSAPLPENNASPPVPEKKAAPIIEMVSRLTLTQLTLIVLTGLFIWQWLDAHYQLNQMQQELAQRLSEAEAASKASQMLVTQNQELVREFGGKLGLLEGRYADMQNQREALETLYRDMSSSRDQTVLAEVEQMLLIANQQLLLSANVKAALIAMQQAEGRLQHMERSPFLQLRQRIQQDVERLRALPSLDISAINIRLDNMIGAVDGLSLQQDARTSPAKNDPDETAELDLWDRFWAEIWQEAKQLVRIQDTGQQELPLLSPSQSFFLRENLKLRLLSARVALLTRDEVSFRRDLKMAQEWLRRYFDVKSESGGQMATTLQQLAASRIVIELPDISGSLDTVRNSRMAYERGIR